MTSDEETIAKRSDDDEEEEEDRVWSVLLGFWSDKVASNASAVLLDDAPYEIFCTSPSIYTGKVNKPWEPSALWPRMVESDTFRVVKTIDAVVCSCLGNLDDDDDDDKDDVDDCYYNYCNEY